MNPTHTKSDLHLVIVDVQHDFAHPEGALFVPGAEQAVKNIADLLHDHSITNVMLVGIGNMGHALLHYRFHERNKMKIVMAFDVDEHPEVGTTTNDGIPIYGISQINNKLRDVNVQTAILTVPSTKAQEVATTLVEAGIKGILSFSPVHLTVPKDVVVQYVDLTSELQTLLYFMKKEH